MVIHEMLSEQMMGKSACASQHNCEFDSHTGGWMGEQVAFTRAGDVLVADGYCNSRVMHYTAEGQLVGKYQLRNVSSPRSH